MIYSMEVIGLISLALLCVAMPLAAVSYGVGALLNTLRGKRGPRSVRAAAAVSPNF